MKQFLLVLALGAAFSSTAQLTLRKGIVIDSIQVNDTIPEDYALYIPKRFDVSKKWPVIFIFDMQGKGRQALGMFREAAEKQGYILAASNNIQDSLSIAKNILISGRLLSSVAALLPLDPNRLYAAGFAAGGRFASMVPTFVNDIKGVISCGAPIANMELLNSRKPFHFLGIVGNEDFNYPEMLYLEKELNKKGFPNQLLVFDGGAEWPSPEYISKAMEMLSLAEMAKKNVARDSIFIARTYKENLNHVNRLMTEQKQWMAHDLLEELIDVYTPLRNVDSLRTSAKTVKRSRGYRSQNRSQNTVFFKESFIKDDYDYYLEEDILTYNYNNLGWWNYQMEELAKYEKSGDRFTRQMGRRLNGYLNALIEDNIDLIRLQQPVDMEALNFLYMLKTITEPNAFEYYLKVISNSAKVDDYGTALFYLEELLKNGYTDVDKLYSLEGTALLRITPEFNDLIEKYLKDARYEIIEE
ncbi:alpha/beta hydrolase [Flavobacteriaceae bacterium TP-CH-4]|uniref:Alpha/beta hydrolase n=1 Tax=Pelagihabitans pacificus TaxID=2696054 RepID=A0A967AUN4_9FLAO|nr:alpha/beta hydrolase [Pelagihabitans pacificus]NHF57912.1 alpha/beta hydrolase [Pelagihabitans pacificus]